MTPILPAAGTGAPRLAGLTGEAAPFTDGFFTLSLEALEARTAPAPVAERRDADLGTGREDGAPVGATAYAPSSEDAPRPARPASSATTPVPEPGMKAAAGPAATRPGTGRGPAGLSALPPPAAPPASRAPLPPEARAEASASPARPIAPTPAAADAPTMIAEPGRPSLPEASQPQASQPQAPLPPETRTAPAPAADAPPRPAPLPAPAETAAQLSRAVAVSPGERSVEVRLDPPALGRVRIEFDFAGDAVRAVVSAAEPEALSLLKRGQQALARDLMDLGLGEPEIEYAEDREAWTGAEAPAPRALVLASVDPAEAAPAPSPRPRLHDGALDILL